MGFFRAETTTSGTSGKWNQNNAPAHWGTMHPSLVLHHHSPTVFHFRYWLRYRLWNITLQQNYPSVCNNYKSFIASDARVGVCAKYYTANRNNRTHWKSQWDINVIVYVSRYQNIPMSTIRKSFSRLILCIMLLCVCFEKSNFYSINIAFPDQKLWNKNTTLLWMLGLLRNCCDHLLNIKKTCFVVLSPL